MISNPRVGMRIRYVNNGSVYSNKLATITTLEDHTIVPISVKFDEPINGRQFYSSTLIEWDVIFPEEEAKYQEQKQREQHADKYL